MTAELEARVAQLEAEVRRLRAKEHVIAAFNRYLYANDTGYGDAILDSYCEDAVLDVLNFPPDGVDLHFESREELAPLYAKYSEGEPAISGGHNATNIAVDVADDAMSAKLTAYFVTTRRAGVQGGRYEGVVRLDTDGAWRFSTLAIISAWGWTADVSTVSESVPASQSAFAGKPATGF